MRKYLIIVLAALTGCAGLHGHSEPAAATPVEQFEMLKGLEGTWLSQAEEAAGGAPAGWLSRRGAPYSGRSVVRGLVGWLELSPPAGRVWRESCGC